jgi:NADH dehydrogenase
MKRVLILGGGFGGVYTAMTLLKTIREEDNLEVSLINRENYMVFQPMMPGVISGSIDLIHCITPIRRLCPRAYLYNRKIESIDLERKQVTAAPVFGPNPLILDYEYLVIALGMINDFSAMPGLKEHALPFKNMADAMELRNRIIHVLEEAAVENDPDNRKTLLTFVVAGGGFSGVEVVAEINDFIHEALGVFHTLKPEDFRVILVHSGTRILPELTEKLGNYAQKVLEKRGVEFRLKDRVTEATADNVILKSGLKIPTRTVVSTVPSAPHPLLAALICEKHNGRLVTTSELQLKGFDNVWAVGDCAYITMPDGSPSPPTAQFAVRQAQLAANNILAAHRKIPTRKTFKFTGRGKAGALGRRSAVAEVMGFTFSGLIAWFFWRMLYWSKMPGLDRKIRVGVDWAMDLILPRDLVQLKIDPSESFSMEHFEAGDYIFTQGDPGNKMYVILRGDVEVIFDEGKPSERTIAKLGAKQYFGEKSLFVGEPRSASVKTITNVDVMTITRADFDLLIRHIPGIKEVFEKEIERRDQENLTKTSSLKVVKD